MFKLAIAAMGAIFVSAGAFVTPLMERMAPANHAYGSAIKVLSLGEHKENVAAIFHRADLNQDQHLDIEEYAALIIVQAQLARLNGFVPIEAQQKSGLIPLAMNDGNSEDRFAGLSRAERIRIDAVARRDFYSASGEDIHMSQAEFVEARQGNFEAADRNGNGQLMGRELAVFGAAEASIVHSEV